MASLEAEKIQAVKVEDYSKAANLKAEIDKLKANSTKGNALPTAQPQSEAASPSMLLPVLECFHSLLNVKTLDVNFGDSDLDDLSKLEQGLGSMTKLHKLCFDFTGCAALKDIGSIGRGLKLLAEAQRLSETSERLSSVDLTFFNLQHLVGGSLKGLMKGVAEHEWLLSLNLDFGFIDSIDVSSMQHLEGLPHLENLKLNFGNSQVVDMEALGGGLKKLEKLKKLELQLYVCLKLVNIDSLGTSLTELKHLEALTIDLYCCNKLKSIDKFMDGVGKLNSLKNLTLSFDGCSKLINIRPIKMAIIELSKTIADSSIKVDIVFACNSWSVVLNKHNQAMALEELK